MVQDSLGGWLRGARAWAAGTTWAERIAALLGTAVLVFSIVTGAVELERQGNSREILAEVKAARLASNAISASCYSTGRRFADQTSPTGFAPGVAEEITELGRLAGEATLLQIDENGYTVLRLLYHEGDFYALYDAEDGYTVWRGEQRIAYEHTNTGGA